MGALQGLGVERQGVMEAPGAAVGIGVVLQALSLSVLGGRHDAVLHRGGNRAAPVGRMCWRVRVQGL